MWHSVNVIIAFVSLGRVVAPVGGQFTLNTAGDDGSGSSVTYTSYVSINHRQVQTIFPPSEPTSTYDYWWPYPPGGVVPSSTLLPTTPALDDSPPDSSPATDNTSLMTIILTTDASSLPDSSTPTMTISATSSPSSSISTTITSTPSSSTTTSPSPAVLLQAKSHKPFKLIYLVPLFAVLGVVLGSFTVWFLYGCLSTRRGPRPRANSLEPGPPYMPTNTEINRGCRDMMREVTPLDYGGSPSKYSLHGSSYNNNNNEGISRPGSIWRTTSTRPSIGGGERTGVLEGNEKKFSWPAPLPGPGRAPNGYHGSGEEEDPFLVHPRSEGGLLTRNTHTRTRAKRSQRLTPSTHDASPDPLSLLDLYEDMEDGEEEEEDAEKYESIRHKSIRRGILERLKFGTLKRPPELEEKGRSGSVRTQNGGSSSSSSSSSFRRTRSTHRRADSDFRVEDVKADNPPNKREWIDVDETEWVAGSGFRIVEEHLNAIREKVRMGDWEEDGGGGAGVRKEKGTVFGKQSVTTTGSWRDDKYTALPTRKSPSKAGRPRLGSSATSTSTASTTQNGLPRVDSSVLPFSPPRITSPPLESNLLFTPVLKQNDVMYGRGIRGTSTSASKGTALTKTKTKRSIRSSSPSTNRPIKDLPRLPASTTSTPTRRVEAALESSAWKRTDNDGVTVAHGRGTPAQRHAAREGALTKVEEILGQSWSERELRGVERVKSPTMFGAVPEVVEG